MKPSKYIAKGWCKGVSAKTAKGKVCKATSRHAVKWCLYGAVDRAYPGEINSEKREQVLSYLSHELQTNFLADWNDKQTSKKPVLKVLQAIGE